MSAETIYQSPYVQLHGALRRELTRYLRTGRALRHPGRQTGQRKNQIPDQISIAERPPEADDRRVPGHWEGELLIGARNATAIGTLVERSTGLALLVPLPNGYTPWQRGSNENTNGLFRQYFPRGFDFTAVTEADLDAVTDELNQRPRKRFGFATPTEQLAELLLR